MNGALVIAAVSAIAAVVSAAAGWLAVDRARVAQQASERMFRRQGVIDLHMAWQGINSIDPDRPITGDVVKAVGALELTAALWNHDIVEKIILYESYWESYRELAETLSGSETCVPGMQRRCCDFISAPVRRAHSEMSRFDTKRVTRTGMSHS